MDDDFDLGIMDYDFHSERADYYFSAYEAVSSVLEFLDFILYSFDDNFLLEIPDILNMFLQLQKMEFLLTDEYLSSCSLEIVGIARNARDILAHVVKKMVKFPKKGEQFVLYEAVVSLLHDLELILRSHDSEQRFRKEDIQIMYDNLSIMDSLLVDSSAQGYDKNLMNGLKHWIGLVANVGREYIDLWPQSLIEKQSTGSFPPSSNNKYVDQMCELTENMKEVNQKLIRLTEKQPTGSFPLSEHIFELHETTSTEGAAQVSCKNLHRITKSIEFVNNRLKRIRDGRDIIQTSTQSLQGTTSTGQAFIKQNKLFIMPNEGGKLVGFERDFSEMLDRLTGDKKKLQVFTVVGMGGSGKTTFTESLYDDPLVRYHFHIRAWFTVSQQYRVKEVLIGLLRCLTDTMTEIYRKNTEDLKHTLYQSLKGKKYLIVLDDMWDKQAWNDLKMIFPSDENGSRIMLTTRLIDVAQSASPDTSCWVITPERWRSR